MSDTSTTPAVTEVTCSVCSHVAQIMAYGADTVHPVTGEAHEIRWQCPCAALDSPCLCKAANLIAGHPGLPGEGALNPGATALSDDEILEAATRRGLIKSIHLSGEVGPSGDSVAATPEGSQ